MESPIFHQLWLETVSRRDPELRADMTAISGAQGLDCSSWQNVISWAPVAASGRDFVYVKASEGTSTSYSTLNAQYQGAINAGLTVGLYHFADPTQSAQANAQAFAAQINRLGATTGHLPPALDLEEGTGDLSGWAAQFVATLRQLTGCQQVAVYSSVSFFSSHIGENWMDDDIILWLADYSAPMGKPRYASPRLAIHQYSNTGQVPGVSCDVDLNYAMRPLNQIIVGESDMTDEEHQMLVDLQDKVDWLYGQFAGLGTDGHPAPFPQVPGWPTLPGGTNQHLSLLDFLRQNNVAVEQLTVAIENAVANAPSGGGGSPVVSQADAQLIAEQVVTEFAAKLGES